jgi:hypothetical protein
MRWRSLLGAATLALSGAAIGAEDGADETPPASTHLICVGEGTANKLAQASIYGSNGWANAYANRESGFEDQVNIDIYWDRPEDSRIRLPRKMLPPLRGGKGGWFELGKLARTEKEITAKAQVNFANSPNVRIDRLTGAISINGKAGDYSGVCQPYDPEQAKPKF